MRSLLFLFVLMAVAYLVGGRWFEVDEVRIVKVQGELAPPEAAQVRRRVGQVLDGRMLTVDVSELREQLLELSWPREVSVRKIWPDTLLVRVARDTVVAGWGEDRYVTPAGEIVDTPNVPPNLPVFDCMVSSPREALAVYDRLRGLAAAAGIEIAGLSENEIGEWRVEISPPWGWSAGALASTVHHGATQLGIDTEGAWPESDEGPVLVLGADELDGRMERFLTAWMRYLRERGENIDTIDLRYGRGMAVRWREPVTQHAEAGGTLGAVGAT